MVKIAPSIIAGDLARLGEEIHAIDVAGADYIHIDIMDGHFVPNLTIGPATVKALRSYTNKPFDVHLMIDHVDKYISAFVEAGSSIITVHSEATCNLDHNLQLIRSLGCKASVALNPETPEYVVQRLLDKIDMILVMSVNPGFIGQKFLCSTLEKINRLHKMIGDLSIEIEVDGGVTSDNAKDIITAGAEVLVAGSAVFCTHDYNTNIATLRY
ncbi:MAG: ribulose-phosphate 3-epimerase [Rhodospirillaceae bacterium]|jgi:ribulose-phosphate 3-epimerase|nr:ribulose-phosphate 3-epimerase [Rhodospirillaceae bacterium]